MVKFTYENQGSDTLLVYHLTQDEHLDSFAKGMLQGNEMGGILKPLFLQRDFDQYLKFPITSKLPLKDYLEKEMEKTTVLNLCLSIAAAISELEAYMLSAEKVLLDADYIFVDLTKKEASLIYLPIDEYAADNSVKEFLLYLLSHMQFQLDGDITYIAKLIHFLNQKSPYKFSELQRFIKKIQSEKENDKPEPGSENPLTNIGNDFATEKQAVVQAMPEKSPNAPPIPEKAEDIPIIGLPEAEKPKKGLFSKTERKTDKKIDKNSKKESTPGIVIPGMAIHGGQPEVILNVDEEGNYVSDQTLLASKKKTGLFSLKKIKKVKQEVSQPEAPPLPRSPEAELKGIEPMGYRPGEYSMPSHVERISSEENNHTVILGGGGDYGSTVILGRSNESEGEQRRQVVKISRRRNGQSMMINKEIFHIGREGGFADFYIGDNPAIGAAHADIFADAGHYYISDRNSVNHTYVNGIMISAGNSQKLVSGDVITLADEDFDIIIS